MTRTRRTTVTTTDRAPNAAPTIDELREVATQIWDSDTNTRRLDANTMIVTDEIRSGLAAEIVRIDGGDLARLTGDSPIYLAGVAIGAWKREARKIADEAARADRVVLAAPTDPDAEEAAARADMIDRNRDPKGTKIRKLAAALADRVVAILDGMAPRATRGDSTEDQLVVALAERLRVRR